MMLHNDSHRLIMGLGGEFFVAMHPEKLPVASFVVFKQRAHKTEGALNGFSLFIDDAGGHTVKHLEQEIAAVDDKEAATVFSRKFI